MISALFFIVVVSNAYESIDRQAQRNNKSEELKRIEGMKICFHKKTEIYNINNNSLHHAWKCYQHSKFN
jgi:hypothetical protein